MAVKVVIIGGGFAGLSAGRVLCRHRRQVEVVLIDRRPYSEFLPLLPDLIGRSIDSSALRFDLLSVVSDWGATFFQGNASSIDVQARVVHTPQASIGFDYLIIAAGSAVNFYGREDVRSHAFTLTTVEDAERICARLKEKRHDNYVVVGGGYTGVEIATNLRRHFGREGSSPAITIVEVTKSILGGLPKSFHEYVRENLRRMNVDVVTEATLDRDGENVTLSNGRVFGNAMLIWSAGVRGAEITETAGHPVTPQGRLIVDEHLSAGGNVFAAGDCAAFMQDGHALRQAVQFSLSEGKCAAENVLRSMRGTPLREYRPFDLGWIIPMANGRSCGQALGVPVKGRLAALLHYSMSIFRTWGFRNKWRLIRELFR